MLIPSICRHIEAATGAAFAAPRQRTAGGGCINSAMVLHSGDQRYFVKTNRAALAAMFEAEAAGLNEIRNTGTVRAPAPVCWGKEGDSAYLVLEYIELGGGGDAASRRLGEQLAAMHRATRANFGWERDNTIGSTPQLNTPADDWIVFWRERRLGAQLELAANNGYRGRLQQRGARLMARFDGLFSGYRPLASLLHGDLWSGNYAADAAGNPVIYDPAPYYGDREADLAMTELFGGFGRPFYEAYQQAWPLDDGYAVRKTLYNVYHVVNHLNLFGGGYLGQAESMIDRLLAELG